jgi:hypothetical protein
MQKSSSVFDENSTKNETLERYYTAIRLAVYSAVLLHYCRTPSSVGLWLIKMSCESKMNDL